MGETMMETKHVSVEAGFADLETRYSKVFVAQVRLIDDGLADIVQGHLNSGYSLATVQAMLKDALKVAQAVRP